MNRDCHRNRLFDLFIGDYVTVTDFRDKKHYGKFTYSIIDGDYVVDNGECKLHLRKSHIKRIEKGDKK